jgi:hypothetical protein
MPPTSPFGCGGPNQPACPPQPTSGTLYTLDEVLAYGQTVYAQGKADHAAEIAQIQTEGTANL